MDGKLGSVKRRVNQRTLLASNRCMYQRETLVYRCLLLPAAVERTSFCGRAGGRAVGGCAKSVLVPGFYFPSH